MSGVPIMLTNVYISFITVLKDSGASSSCVTSNPCQNGGSCMEKGNDVFCRCHGNWRGRVCNSSKYI